MNFRHLAMSAAILSASFSAHAIKLSDYTPYEHDVRFTNPKCGVYKYEQEVKSSSGKILTQKPKDIYCTQADSKVSGSQNHSPQKKLLEWINDPSTTEIFFTYLSFSNSTVQKALCSAVKDRGVKLTFIIDTTSDTSIGDALKACGGNGATNKVTMYQRGHSGPSNDQIGYAHNKVFMINPNDPNVTKLVFSSGNMSSGVVLHQENWHFITTSAKSFFARAHLCMRDGMISAEANKGASKYAEFMRSCKQKILASGVQEEDDIKTFFIPGEGQASTLTGPSATAYIKMGIENSTQIDVAAHRFSYSQMISALSKKLQVDKKAKVRIVVDDDTYWIGAKGESVGDNTPDEYQNIKNLESIGGSRVETRYLETNQFSHLLHHNKFLIFRNPANPSKEAVFCGAGNLTGAAFRTNYEDFYYITTPAVVEKFKNQYDSWLFAKGTAEVDLPSEDIQPSDIPAIDGLGKLNPITKVNSLLIKAKAAAKKAAEALKRELVEPEGDEYELPADQQKNLDEQTDKEVEQVRK